MAKRFVEYVSTIFAATLLFFQAGTCPAADDYYYQWVNTTNNAAWNPRDGAGGLVYDGKMWLIGGWNPGLLPKKCDNEVWNSTDGANWTLVKPNTFTSTYDPNTDWEGRHTAGYVVYDNKMWMVGGDPLQGHYQSDVWNSTDGVTWTHVNANNPAPWGQRALHHTLVFDNKIWVMGGQTTPQFAPADEHFYNDIWNSSDGVNWTKVETEGPMWSPRGQIGNNVVFNGRMWILGGGTYDTPTTPTRNYYNDVWSSADGVHWEKHIDNAPWHTRQYHEVAVWDDKMWVMEGWDGTSNRKDVWYSADGVNWQEVPNTPWAPRHAATVYTYDDALWMVAGNNMGRDAWKLVRVTNPPEPTGSSSINFEGPTYSAGSAFVGVDGWQQWVVSANVITPSGGDSRVIDGAQSARIGGSGTAILYRNFAPGTSYADGSTLSARVIAGGTAGGQVEFHFSHAMTSGATPAGIIGIVGENFHIFGLGGNGSTGIDTGIPFQSEVDYLLEFILNFTDQTFSCFATDMDGGGGRFSLGTAGFNTGAYVSPGAMSDSGLVIAARGGALAIYDNLRLSPSVPGDANRDGAVDEADAQILAEHWQTATNAAWGDGDFNGDGAVNDLDAALMAANWNFSLATATVPEPSLAATLLALMIFAFINVAHVRQGKSKV